MENMYERIKKMTFEEMQKFIYWVYENGVEDGENNCNDSYGFGYFGGQFLDMNANDVMSEMEGFYRYEL